ncbi:MAG TPA: phosphate acyltransferase PlsX [Acetivibrio sp.]|nr:phosphate acyltransferase PlsX [Clostridium sp.]HOQ37347.1 phosphate acyltransferase PlsX [Acetivibrio sp.]HQA57774.1 phosphate acyltransferase PlsX [Acetivibrio sp.]
MVILVDAMGGDNAPEAIVNGCLDAVGEAEGFDILLIGDEGKIREILSKRDYDRSRINIHHTSEVITVEDVPTKAIKSKKDSSMVVGFKLLKEKQGDVFLSCGNSGALMAGALFIVGRLKGVDRPALGAIVPTKTGRGLIIDAGLNTICKPINYLQFSIMGSIYMKEMLGIDNPKVGLLNIGAEVGKGNETLKHAYSMLSEANINFLGNVEGNDVPLGAVDVVVCDGFAGNVMLKFYEGAASFLVGMLKDIYYKNLKTKLSALMIQKEMKQFKKVMDADEQGGAPILGVNGLVFKSHGSSNARTIKNVVIKAGKLAKTKAMDRIREEFVNMEVEEIEHDL